MSKDIQEAIEQCRQIIKDNNEIVKEARKNGDINTMQLTASLDNDSLAIETVLNYIENSIPTEVIEEKIEELGIAILECEYSDDDIEEYKEDVEKNKRRLLIQKSVLQDLLENK